MKRFNEMFGRNKKQGKRFNAKGVELEELYEKARHLAYSIWYRKITPESEKRIIEFQREIKPIIKKLEKFYNSL